MKQEMAALPGNTRQWIHVGLAAVLVILVFVSALAVAMHVADDQFIDNDELGQNLRELESYSAEASLLASYQAKNSAPRPYVESYSSALKKATDSVSEKLETHPHADALSKQVTRTVHLAHLLSSQLNDLSSQPTKQLPPTSSASFQKINDGLSHVEQTI